MTAGQTTERGGSSELQDELEVIEKMEDRQQVMHHWQESLNLRTHGQNCYLTQTKLPAAAAKSRITDSVFA